MFAAAVASTTLFCSIAFREWGENALWPCRAFGVLAAAPIFTGLYSYTLGFTAMLAALRAIAAWREREAQKSNNPRGRMLKDEALLEIAASAPDSEGLE